MDAPIRCCRRRTPATRSTVAWASSTSAATCNSRARDASRRLGNRRDPVGHADRERVAQHKTNRDARGRHSRANPNAPAVRRRACTTTAATLLRPAFLELNGTASSSTGASGSAASASSASSSSEMSRSLISVSTASDMGRPYPSVVASSLHEPVPSRLLYTGRRRARRRFLRVRPVRHPHRRSGDCRGRWALRTPRHRRSRPGPDVELDLALPNATSASWLPWV